MTRPQAPRTPHKRRPIKRPEPTPTGHGTLNIASRPVGVPYIDGTRVGAETPVAGIRLSAGAHTVKVHFTQAGRDVTRRVRIEPGETEGVFVVLRD